MSNKAEPCLPKTGMIPSSSELSLSIWTASVYRGFARKFVDFESCFADATAGIYKVIFIQYHPKKKEQGFL